MKGEEAPNPNSDPCLRCGRKKLKTPPFYDRSLSTPAPRSSSPVKVAALFRNKSDVPSPSVPGLPHSPAFLNVAGKNSPENPIISRRIEESFATPERNVALFRNNSDVPSPSVPWCLDSPGDLNVSAPAPDQKHPENPIIFRKMEESLSTPDAKGAGKAAGDERLLRFKEHLAEMGKDVAEMMKAAEGGIDSTKRTREEFSPTTNGDTLKISFTCPCGRIIEIRVAGIHSGPIEIEQKGD